MTSKIQQLRRRQNIKQQISARINWLLFQLQGSVSNISSSFARLVNDPARFELKDVELYKLYNWHDRTKRATNELKAVTKEIAEWNKTKTWVD